MNKTNKIGIKVISVLLALVVFLGALPISVAAAETGRTPSDPIIVTMGSSYTKTWTKDTDHLYWYNKITISENGILNMQFSKPLDSEGEMGRLYVELYDEDDELVWETNCDSAQENASMYYKWNVGLPEGDYYVKVKPGFAVTSGTISSTWSFSFNADDYCELEPNGTAAKANPIVAGHVYTGYLGCDFGIDDDWYKIYLSEGSTYKIALDWDKLASTTAMAYVIAPDGDEYGLSFRIEDAVVFDKYGYPYVNYTAKSSGYHYIKIYNYGAEQLQYHIHVEAPPCSKHAWDSGVVIEEPTTLKAGMKKFTCSACGATKTDYIRAINDQFTDTKPGEYYYTPVLWAVANGITAGTSTTKFSPDATCTRAQVVTFLWRAKGEPEPTNTEMPFTDVDEDDYYYTAVLWAVENGITSGTSTTKFSPDAGCTRGQVVTFLWRTEDKPEPVSSTNPFKDVKTGEYYYTAVLWAVENGITSGVSAKSFSPNTTCTRAQIVSFLYRDLAE